MPANETLLEKVKKLVEQNQNDEAIQLLDDNTLLKANDGDLYTQRAIAWSNKKEYDKAIPDFTKATTLAPGNWYAWGYLGWVYLEKKEYDNVLIATNKAIELAPEQAYGYNNLGRAYIGQKEYDKAIAEFDKSIELDSNYVIAYNNRGLAWLEKKEYDKAMADLNKALEIDPNYVFAYNNISTIWYEKKEYDKTVACCNQTLDLDPNNTYAYNNRGRAWLEKMEYDKAMDDFDKILALGFPDAYVYNNKGVAWKNKKEYDNAIEAFSKALQLDPGYVLSYTNRGLTWMDKEDYKKSIDDFNKAIELEPNNATAKYNRDLAMTKLGSLVVTDDASKDISLYFLVNIVEGLEEEDQKNIRKAGAVTIEIIDNIRKYALSIPKEPVAHYSKLPVADILTCAKTDAQIKFRYYNVIYMNDPEEGEILLECLDDMDIRKAFKAGGLKEEDNVYLGSFLPATHEDDLVMWRTYGKDEKNMEAAGCSLVIDLDFFDTDNRYLQSDLRTNNKSETESKQEDKILGQALYRVLYFDKRQCVIVGENSDKIQEEIQKLILALKRLIALKDGQQANAAKNGVIDRIVYRFLSELRYLFKSSDYAFENELRVIQYASPEKDIVQIDDNNGQWLPKRLYIESTKSIQPHLKKIILGPKVSGPGKWTYLEVAMKKKGYKMEVKSSVCKFQ